VRAAEVVGLVIAAVVAGFTINIFYHCCPAIGS